MTYLHSTPATVDDSRGSSSALQSDIAEDADGSEEEADGWCGGGGMRSSHPTTPQPCGVGLQPHPINLLEKLRGDASHQPARACDSVASAASGLGRNELTQKGLQDPTTTDQLMEWDIIPADPSTPPFLTLLRGQMVVTI